MSNVVLMIDEMAEATQLIETSPGIYKEVCTISKISFIPFVALAATAVELKPDESLGELLEAYHKVGKDCSSGNWAAQTPLTFSCDTLKVYVPNIKLQQEYLQSIFKSD